MIVSPPFLSQTELPVYDEQCINQVMPGGFMGSGAYPVSVGMGWHGGIHIHAPTADEPVRAIADGMVVFRRDAGTIQYADKDTSTGCVVIRHTTEIGADGTDKPVEFTYYSISMHLRKLDDTLPQVGKPIYRKDKLGLAGKIHGASARIHFEIIAGDKDIEALTGRKTGRISLQNDGRKSVVYGTSYVFVPSGAAYLNGQVAPSSRPGAALPAPSGQTTEDVVIGVHKMNTDYAIQRITNVGWKTYDVFLLGFAFAHGMNGLRQVLRDYIHDPKIFQVVSYILLIVWLVITIVGAIALFAINRPLGN